jgi:large repetitive protein
MVIVSGQNTGSITVRMNGTPVSENGFVRCTPINYCEVTNNPAFSIRMMPPQTPFPITMSISDGYYNACQAMGLNGNLLFSTIGASFASSYLWTLPPGLEIVSGANTTHITTRFLTGFTGGTVTVQAVNSCGTSGVRSFTIPSTTPLVRIDGPTNTCLHQGINATPAVYSTLFDPGNVYTWAVPQGATIVSGQGTNTILVRFAVGFTNGAITCTGLNGCNISNTRTFNVGTLFPAAPSAIDVIELQPCPNRVLSYTIATMPSNTTSLLWTVPAGATILSGQGSTSITVSYPNTIVEGVVGVASVSNCRTSGVRTTPVKLPACPPVFSGKGEQEIRVTGLAKDETSAETSIGVYPNPTNDQFNLQLNGFTNGSLLMTIRNAQGQEIKKQQYLTVTGIRFGSGLKPGIYFVTVMQGDKTKTVRVVKY